MKIPLYTDPTPYLNGTQTMFRVVVEPQPTSDMEDVVFFEDYWTCENYRFAKDNRLWVTKPRYPIGSTLVVREKWRVSIVTAVGIIIEYKSKPSVAIERRIYNHDKYSQKKYRNWQNPTHMPYEFSRCRLTVTGNKVERVQEISDYDCHLSGIKLTSEDGENYVPDFAKCFDRKHGKGSWEQNPWCECVTVERSEG